MIGCRRIFLCFFLDGDLLLRTCSQQSNEGRSAIPFINSDPLYLQQAKPNLQNFSWYPLHHMLHSQQAIPNHWVPELSLLPSSSTWCYGSRPNHANRWIPAGLSFSIFLHQLDFSHSSKFEPILPLPHIGLVTDTPHPPGPHIILFTSSLLLQSSFFMQEMCINVLLRSVDRWISGHNSLKQIPQLEFLKSLWGLGTEDE